jgi:methyltransferase (TIGR00027 family)
MSASQPNHGLLIAATMRAQHQLLDAPVILRDPVTVELVPEAHRLDVLGEFGNPSDGIATQFRAMFAMRSRFAEDRLADAVARGVRQYVLIGAGLDTFPWRQPAFAQDIQIFAADHPASLAWVQGRLRHHGFGRPTNLTYVPVDLDKRDFADQLIACGFDLSIPSFCSMLGVTQYLDPITVGAVLEFVASLEPESEIVASFVPPDDSLKGPGRDAVRRTSIQLAQQGAPFTCRLSAKDAISRLHDFRFRDVFHLTPELAQERYFVGRTDALRAPGWVQLIAAIV